MIHRVTNPDAARAPQVYAAVRRALVASGFERDADLGTAHLFACCRFPTCGLWVAVERGEVVGVIAVFLPNNPLAQHPEVAIAASWGPPAVYKDLQRAAVEFVKAAGYNKIAAWDRTGRGEAVIRRKYRTHGAVVPAGTMYLCELEGENARGNQLGVEQQQLNTP